MSSKVLVVEDNPANRTLLKKVLSHHGYEVLEATNGLEGINMAIDRKPDIILMDLQMPVMEGTEAIKLLKEDVRTKAIPIIAITSFAMKGDKERALDTGADGYISKPVDTRELPKTIEQYLKR